MWPGNLCRPFFVIDLVELVNFFPPPGPTLYIQTANYVSLLKSWAITMTGLPVLANVSIFFFVGLLCAMANKIPEDVQSDTLWLSKISCSSFLL